ncbi:MAG: glycosyltransferase family 4 protein, partial [Candidatus Cloacimonadia bacterium]
MKILHFIHAFIPIYGGTTTRMINLFTNDGNEHVIIAPNIGSQYVPQNITQLNSSDTYENITIHRVPLSNFKTDRIPFSEYISRIIHFRRNSLELLKGVNTEDFDLVYGHFSPMEFAFAAYQYSRDNSIPLFIEIHALFKDTLFWSRNPLKKIYNSIGNAILLRMEKNILNHASRIIVQTKSMGRRLKEEYGFGDKKINVVYNGVDIDKFSAGKYREQSFLLEKTHKTRGKCVLSYIGFLDNNNGINFFLQSLESLPESVKSNIKVFLIGRGPYSKLVEDFSARNDFLEYLGMVDYNEIPQYYSITDIFVIARPSNLATENFIPMKLLEAMAMEKIVLVSNVGGMTEVVSHMKNGIVFKANDIDDFNKKLTDAVFSIDTYKQLGAQ